MTFHLGIIDLFGTPEHKPSNPDVSIIKAENLISETRAAKVNGFGFSEVMSGFIHVADHMSGGKKEDFEVAAKAARGLCQAARFFLSVKAWNTDTSK